MCLFKRGDMLAIGLLFLLSRPRFGLLEAGDVGVRADDSSDAAVGIPLNRFAPAQNPDVMPVPVLLAILE